MLFASSVFAQKFFQQEITHAISKELPPVTPNGAASHSDTLGLDTYGDQIFQYTSNVGYIFGISDLEGVVQGQTINQLNLEYAAGYIVNDTYNVIGAMMWFGGKSDVSGNPADLVVKMYSLADNKAVSTAQTQTPDVTGPEQMLASVNLPFSDVDTASFNIPTFAMFSSPVSIQTDFALAVDISGLYTSPADTAWLYASEDGASDGFYTWTALAARLQTGQVTPSTWALSTGLLQGGLDVNLGIFAIVEESPNGIEEQGFLNGVKMTTYPNPALSSDNVTIQYAVEKAVNKVELNIYNMNGQLVFTSAEGAKASGLYNLSIPTGTLNAGSYIYSIEAEGARMAKRMEILK